MLDENVGSLGVSQARYGKRSFDYAGNEGSYSGKIVFLVDQMTGSSAEMLAAGLQANGQAKVVGSRTAGAVLRSTIELLPNGMVLQFPIADFATSDGKVLGGRGITPDVDVKMTKDDVSSGHDAMLETAIRDVGSR